MATDDNPPLSRSLSTSDPDNLRLNRENSKVIELPNRAPQDASLIRATSSTVNLSAIVNPPAQQPHVVHASSAAPTNTESPSLISVCSPISSSRSKVSSNSSQGDAKVPGQEPGRYSLPVQSQVHAKSAESHAKLPSNKFGDGRAFLPAYTIGSAAPYTPRSPPPRGPFNAAGSSLHAQPTLAQVFQPFPPNGNVFANVNPYQWSYPLGAMPVTTWPPPYAASYRFPLSAVQLDQRFPSSLLPGAYNVDPSFPNMFYNPIVPFAYGFNSLSSPANALSLHAQRAANPNFAGFVTPRSNISAASAVRTPYVSSGSQEQRQRTGGKSSRMIVNDDADQDDNNSVPPAGTTPNFAASNTILIRDPLQPPDDESTSNDDAAGHNKTERRSNKKLKRRHSSVREPTVDSDVDDPVADPEDAAPQRFKTLIDAVQSQEVAATAPLLQKRQRRKKPRDPSKGPKLPLSGYLFYVSEQRQMMAKYEEYAEHTFTEMARIIGERWKNLSKQERKPYEEKADMDKARYEREKCQFLLRATNANSSLNFGTTSEAAPNFGTPLHSPPRATVPISIAGTGATAYEGEPAETQHSVQQTPRHTEPLPK